MEVQYLKNLRHEQIVYLQTIKFVEAAIAKTKNVREALTFLLKSANLLS